MAPEQQLAKLMKLAKAKNGFIDASLLKIDALLKSNSSELTKKLLSKVLDKMSQEDGVINTSSSNLIKALGAGAVVDEFMQKAGASLVKALSKDLVKLTDHNQSYYSELAGKELSKTEIDKVIKARLGLTETGNIKKTGFMAQVATSPEVKKDIVNFLSDKISSSAGFNEVSKGLKELVAGKPGQPGAFQKYYRNTVYDAFGKVDALNSSMFADKLKLNYFIYAGTRRQHSRQFCLTRKGKVFSREEAMQWKDLIGSTTEVDGKRVPAGPIVTKQDAVTYDPFIDRGGYGCVDDINWISDEIAFAKRPELRATQPFASSPKDLINKKYKPEEQPKIQDDISLEDAMRFMRMAGVPEGLDTGSVTVLKSSKVKDGIGVIVKNKDMTMIRVFDVNKGIVNNKTFEINESSPYKGKGAFIFNDQVEALQNSPFKVIQTNAAYDGLYNGYYTWARMGYEAIPGQKNVIKRIEEYKEAVGITEINSISDIMATDHGRKWWKENGTTFEGVFDLNPNSKSYKTLSNYVAGRKK